MKMKINLVLLALITLVAAGCNTTGLSVREKGQYNYSSMLYSMYDNETMQSNGREDITGPIRLAVAQIGETAAPEKMIENFKDERSMIKEVMSIPASGIKLNNNGSAENPEDAYSQFTKMRRLAKHLGADYLFVFGGAADYETTNNFLSFFDMTVIGAYILPSQKHTAEGKASGALINVRTGQVAFLVSSEAQAKKYSPSYFEYTYYGSNANSTGVLTELRDELIEEITENFLQKLMAQS